MGDSLSLVKMLPGFIINSTVSQIKLSKKIGPAWKLLCLLKFTGSVWTMNVFWMIPIFSKLIHSKHPNWKKLPLQPVTKSKYLNNPNVLTLKVHLEVRTVCYFMLGSTQVDSVIPFGFLMSSVQAMQCLRPVIYCLPQNHASTFLDWCPAVWMPHCWEHCSQQALVRYWKTPPSSTAECKTRSTSFHIPWDIILWWQWF